MSFLENILDIIYPPLCVCCGVKLSRHGLFFICPDCARGITYIKKPYCFVCGYPGKSGKCRKCQTQDYFFSSARSSCSYEGPAAEAVRAFKFGKNLWLSTTMGKILKNGLFECPELASADVIVPVPLSRVREKQRGFNQSEILARFAGDFLQKPVSSRNLSRVKNSSPQTELSAAERVENVKGIFALRHLPEFDGREVLLIDDVFTTGSTVNECSRTLLASGALRVRVFTLARRI